MAKGNTVAVVDGSREQLAARAQFAKERFGADHMDEREDLSEDFDSEEDSEGSEAGDINGGNGTGTSAVSMMEHAIHSLRRRRNKRERMRWRKIRRAFESLRKKVPRGEFEELSQLTTLRRASKYIQYLSTMLETGAYDEKAEQQIIQEDSDREQVCAGSGTDSGKEEAVKVPEGSFCSLCKRRKSEVGNRIIVCDRCNMAFHQECHQPAVPEGLLRINEKWTCSFCNCGVDQTVLGGSKGSSRAGVTMRRYNNGPRRLRAKSAPHWNAGFKRYHSNDVTQYAASPDYYRHFNGLHKLPHMPGKVPLPGSAPCVNGMRNGTVGHFAPVQLPPSSGQTARHGEWPKGKTVPVAQRALVGLDSKELINVFNTHHTTVVTALTLALEKCTPNPLPTSNRESPNSHAQDKGERPGDEQEVLCVACQRRAAFWCSVCWHVAYCSKSCQEQAWREHCYRCVPSAGR